MNKRIKANWSRFNKKIDYPNIIVGALIGVFIGWIAQPLFNVIENKIIVEDVESIKYEKQRIELFNKKGKSILQTDLDININKAILSDVLGNEDKEIIIGVGDNCTKSGFIQIYDQKLNLLWEYDTYDTTIMNSLNELRAGHSDHFIISDFYVKDIYNNGKKYIVACSIDPTWFTSRLVILDPEKKELHGEFWHPGILNEMRIDDLDKDGICEIICSGYNNQLRSYFKSNQNVPVIFAVSTENMTGQCFPGAYKEPEIKPTLWYNLIPPFTIKLNFKIEDAGEYKEIRVLTNEGIFYYFNNLGEIVGIASSDSRRQKQPDARTLSPISIISTNNEWNLESTPLKIKHISSDLGGLYLGRAINLYRNEKYDSVYKQLDLALFYNSDLKRIVKLWKTKAKLKGNFPYVGVVLNESKDLVIEEVAPSSPASKSGIMKNDKIISVNCIKINDNLEFQLSIISMQIGDTIDIYIERNNKIINKNIVLENIKD